MDIVAILATNAIAVGVVGYLLKLWVDKRLAHALGIELERFKAELAKEVARHSIQTTWNHNKKMELFGLLYEHMIDADFQLKALLMNIKVGDRESIRQRAIQFSEKYLELNSCLHKNELFLEQSLVDQVRAVYQPYFEVAQTALGSEADIEQFRSKLPNKMEEIFSIGDSPRKKIVEQFRKYAGLDV